MSLHVCMSTGPAMISSPWHAPVCSNILADVMVNSPIGTFLLLKIIAKIMPTQGILNITVCWEDGILSV